MTSPLRALIEDMINDLEKNPVETHPARLAEIAETVPHTIEPLPSTEPLERYNCVMHALGLIGRIDYEHPLLLAKTAFVRYLIAEVLTPSELRVGALIVWSSTAGVQHVGKVIAPGRCESKWGIGILCAHGFDEIPLRYGEVSGFYGPIDPGKALDYLSVWIQRRP
jgi:hypothetical protein